MKVSNILKGIAVFQKYGISDYYISAEHDQIIVEQHTSKMIEEEDLNTLYELGWYQPEACEYEFNEHWTALV